MRILYAFLFALLLVVFAPFHLLAQTIKFDDKSPSSPAAGTISGQGSYTIGDNQTLLRIKLHAVNPKGGPGGEKACEIDTDKKTWNGQIAQLPAATYKVHARLTYRITGVAKEYVVDTPLVDVPVK